MVGIDIRLPKAVLSCYIGIRSREMEYYRSFFTGLCTTCISLIMNGNKSIHSFFVIRFYRIYTRAPFYRVLF